MNALRIAIQYEDITKESHVTKEFLTGAKHKAGYAQMFFKRLGEGLSTAYCAFGLRKYNSSWFTDSYGKEWLDLKTRSSS